MSWPAGVGRVTFDEIDSTNAEARRRAAAGEAGPVWLHALRQTAGKGRRGRGWETPSGDLAATLLIRPGRPPAEAALLSFVAALAVYDCVKALAPDLPVALKWPNDPLVNDRKVSGILLEGEGGANPWLAIGVGINLANHPDVTEHTSATSIRRETGTAPAPETALEHLATAMAHWSAIFDRDGFPPIRSAWLARAARLGERIEARLATETLTGVFHDIDMNGALVLATSAGHRNISAADVFFGP